MRLDGLHHVTMITADARENVRFYADLLGLRLVKRTVNFDQPDAYHLYFGDEAGSPGSILTWFEFPGAAPGRAGAGMIHRLELGVGSEESLEFWERRLAAGGCAPRREANALRVEDYDGLAFALVLARGDDALRAEHPQIPSEHAITGIQAARAYTPAAIVGEESPLLTHTLGFAATGEAGEYLLEGARRGFGWSYDAAPAEVGLQGAGTVHHIAWACRDEDQLGWRERVRTAGRHVTDVLDREYFRSIYFREERGVLFEIATRSPGFAVDEDGQHLGEQLRLPAQYEPRRSSLEALLTPIENPRTARRRPEG